MKFDLTKKYGKDPKKAAEGVWMPLSNFPGIEVKVRPFSSTDSIALYDSLQRKHKTVLNLGGEAAIEKSKEITRKVLAEKLITDWRGIESAGHPVPFSKEQAEELFKELPEFADAVSALTMAEDIFKREEREDDAKNSGATSAGNSATEASAVTETPPAAAV